jgi:5-methylcytosine-specific restriction protein A
VWFVFNDGKDLWLGAEREPVWRLASRSDEEDERYQAATEATAAENGQEATRLVSGMQFVRNPALAIKRFELAGYQCEADPAHRLFTSRASGQPFLEAHHLIPVALHSHFKGQSLDVIDNIFAMCPMCHRAVHHAQCDRTLEIIDRLISARKEVLASLGVTPSDLCKIYSCEKIER